MFAYAHYLLEYGVEFYGLENEESKKNLLVYVYMSMCVYMYIHKHTHTYIQTHKFFQFQVLFNSNKSYL